MASRKGTRTGFNKSLDVVSPMERLAAAKRRKAITNPFQIGDVVYPTDSYGKRLKCGAGVVYEMTQALYGSWCIKITLETGVNYACYYPRGVKHEYLTPTQLKIRNILRKTMQKPVISLPVVQEAIAA